MGCIGIYRGSGDLGVMRLFSQPHVDRMGRAQSILVASIILLISIFYVRLLQDTCGCSTASIWDNGLGIRDSVV